MNTISQNAKHRRKNQLKDMKVEDREKAQLLRACTAFAEDLSSHTQIVQIPASDDLTPSCGHCRQLRPYVPFPTQTYLQYPS